MTKYVEWVQPYDEYCDIPQILRLTLEDAVKVQKRALVKSGNASFQYESDEQALDDFVCVHWAKIVENHES